MVSLKVTIGHAPIEHSLVTFSAENRFNLGKDEAAGNALALNKLCARTAQQRHKWLVGRICVPGLFVFIQLSDQSRD
ncbi:hypothetical protein AX279_17465 [Pseudomonas sp. J237]|nr:hypothetical protein AX279_17465 [Pseudomonas sp. J237]